jgi:branched-chain amino acid transport system permease protein
MTHTADTSRLARIVARHKQRGIWLAMAVVLGVLPLLFDNIFAYAIMIQMGIMIIFTLSYNMLLGQGGMLSFGHAVYFGMGGFLSMHVVNFIEAGSISLPIPLLPLVGGVFGLIIALIFGSFSTRRAGTVFAMISLGIGEMVAASSLIFVAFFGGEEGVSGDRTSGPTIFGIDYATDLQVYYVIAFWVLVSTFLMYKFSRTPAGRMANAVRDNPERVEFVGYSQRYVRLITFCAAGFFAGIAGGLFAIAYEILTEETLNTATSFNVLLMAYIGGVGFFAGPIVGAIIFTFLQTVLSTYTEIWGLYVGIVFVLTVLFVPQGLTGILMIHAPVYQQGRLRSLVVPYLAMAVPVLAFVLGIVGLLEIMHFWKLTTADERLTNLFSVSVNIDSPLPWLTLIAMTAIGAFGMWKFTPLVRQAWEVANGRAEDTAAAPDVPSAAAMAPSSQAGEPGTTSS